MAHLKSLVTLRPTPAPEQAGASLADRYSACRKQTDFLVSGLTAEDQMVQSCPDASPSKWHLAHTSWFFETFILSQHLSGYRQFDAKFRDLFNSYYNAVGQQPEKALRNTFSRPALEDIQKYRRHVDEHMLELLESSELAETVEPLVELGINHEQQHQELLVTDIKHAFWTNPLRPAYQANSSRPLNDADAGEIPIQKAPAHPEGIREVGALPGAFHFDNESPRHRVFLAAFRLASRLATCGEYLAFMDDRGYERPELWLSDGWKAVQAHRWIAPLYWEKDGAGWVQFTCSGMRRISEREPVCHVSFYEADAFARWAGARLPTEFEWEVAAEEIPVEGNLVESGKFHPQPAPEAEKDSAAPVQIAPVQVAPVQVAPVQVVPVQVFPVQIYGDVWEWTASAYLPYPGFKPAEGALGEYNGKFMSNQMVLRGGSCITPRSHIRASYRNFFPPETRWQFSGIRLADDSI